MSCFFGCFGTPKKGRRRKIASNSRTTGRVQIQLEEQHEAYQAIQPILVKKKLDHESLVSEGVPELRGKTEQPSFTKTKKKVKFDLNVTTYEEAAVCKDTSTSFHAEQQEHQGKEEEKPFKGEENLTSQHLGTFPENHRYQNSIFSDDEGIEEDIEDEFDDDFEDSDLDLDCNDNVFDGDDQEEESFDSYFSLQIDKAWPEMEEVTNAKNSNATSAELKPAISARHSARDRSRFVHSVLSPVENLSQWKVAKGKQVPTKNSKKGTTDCHLKEKLVCHHGSEAIPRDSQFSSDLISAELEVAVNASLSNWLPSQEATGVEQSMGRNASDSKFPKMIDEEQKKLSFSTSTQEMPILGDDVNSSKHPEAVGIRKT